MWKKIHFGICSVIPQDDQEHLNEDLWSVLPIHSLYSLSLECVLFSLENHYTCHPEETDFFEGYSFSSFLIIFLWHEHVKWWYERTSSWLNITPIKEKYV